MPDLPQKEARFLEAYLALRNGRQAAIDAGYAPSSASNTARRLLRKAELKAALDAAEAERAALATVTRERVLKELASIAFGSEGAGKATQANRLAALTLIGRHLGLWKDGPTVIRTGAETRESMGIERIIIDPAKE